MKTETTVEPEEIDWEQIDADDLLEELKQDPIFDDLEDELRENAKNQEIRNTYKQKIEDETVFDKTPLSSKLPVALQFALNCFVSTKTVVTDATVDDIDIYNDTLTLTVHGPDTRPVEDRSDDRTHRETFEFDLNDTEDQKQLESVLSHADVSEPTDLYEEEIPVFTHVPNNYRYELYSPLESPKDYTKLALSRISRKLRMLSVKNSTDTNSGYTLMPTKNFHAILVLFGGLLTVALSDPGFPTLALIPYVSAVAYTILRGSADAFMNKSGERDWIHQLIE